MSGLQRPEWVLRTRAEWGGAAPRGRGWRGSPPGWRVQRPLGRRIQRQHPGEEGTEGAPLPGAEGTEGAPLGQRVEREPPTPGQRVELSAHLTVLLEAAEDGPQQAAPLRDCPGPDLADDGASQGGLRHRGFSPTTLPERSAARGDAERRWCWDTEEPRPRGSCSSWVPKSQQPNRLVHEAPAGQMSEHSQGALKTHSEGRHLPRG